MKRIVLLMIAAITVVVLLVAALAVSGSETPNDPRVNPDANACYTGGSWVGKCKLDDELWIAGWYEIRLEYGLISGDQVPAQYKWILPQVTQEPASLPTPTLKPL
jgi:hypothetical protein